MNRAEELISELVKLWDPPKQISVSEWADEFFYLSPEYAAEHGRFTTLSFQKEPLDCISDPLVWQVVIKSCTQILKTTVIQVGTAYVIDKDPGPILIIQPRDADAKSFSKERIAPMFRDVPCLRGKVSEAKSRSSENTIEEKYFRGGMLAITSAGSPGNLARRAVRFLFGDEEDKWPESAGSEGKPFSLALKRTATFRHRKKAIRCCSPTVPGSSIDTAYEDSDRREYFVTCPYRDCRFEQSMMLKFRTHVRWDADLPTREEQAKSARYYCQNCDRPWDDAMRWKAIENGKWIAQGTFNGIAGFWISELYSPWKTLADIVLDFLMKKSNAEDLKTFVNTSLAENWKEPGETLEWRNLESKREPYPVGRVPAGGLFLTAGVDVQREEGGRLEVEIVAFGENRESWSVDYRKLIGNPAEPQVWEQLEDLLHETFPHELGGDLPIERMFVDSGDGTVTRSVYEWVRKQPRPVVYAIKGDRRSDQPVSIPKAVEVDAFGRKTPFGAILRLINVDYFKASFLADLKKVPPTAEELEAGLPYPQGYCHFPLDGLYGDEYWKQVCSEQLVTRKDKQGRIKHEYQQIRPRNEALDTRIYAMAGAWDFGSHKFQKQHWDKLKLRAAVQNREQKVNLTTAEKVLSEQRLQRQQDTFRPVVGRFNL